MSSAVARAVPACPTARRATGQAGRSGRVPGIGPETGRVIGQETGSEIALANGVVIGPGSLTGPEFPIEAAYLTGPVHRTARGPPTGRGAAVNGPPP
ncbi:hypothetical protein D3C72_1445330 [compost metagenome]